MRTPARRYQPPRTERAGHDGWRIPLPRQENSNVVLTRG